MAREHLRDIVPDLGGTVSAHRESAHHSSFLVLLVLKAPIADLERHLFILVRDPPVLVRDPRFEAAVEFRVTDRLDEPDLPFLLVVLELCGGSSYRQKRAQEQR